MIRACRAKKAAMDRAKAEPISAHAMYTPSTKMRKMITVVKSSGELDSLNLQSFGKAAM